MLADKGIKGFAFTIDTGTHASIDLCLTYGVIKILGQTDQYTELYSKYHNEEKYIDFIYKQISIIRNHKTTKELFSLRGKDLPRSPELENAIKILKERKIGH